MLRLPEELNRASRLLSIKLVMNLDCNLACRYCFEGNRKGRFYMSQEIADEFVNFVRARITSQRLSMETRRQKGGGFIDEVFITFYGGEPLLSRKLIVHTARKLKTLAGRLGKAFSFALQTNGTLLTKEVVQELRPLGLAEAYVTVDGPRENHDAFRPYKSGRGSFDVIMRNVQDVCGLVDLKLGGNFTKDNYRSFPGFLDYLIESGLTPDKVPSVGCFTVVSEGADVLPDYRGGCSSVNESWLFSSGPFLREEILRRGYHGERLTPVVCMMEHWNNFLVNYNGDIYKCPCLIGRKEFCVGNIKTGVNDFRTSHNLDNWKNEQCLNCSYLPLCLGGCRYMKFVRDGNMDGVDCKKPYFDATLEAFVKQDIRYDLIKEK